MALNAIGQGADDDFERLSALLPIDPTHDA